MQDAVVYRCFIDYFGGGGSRCDRNGLSVTDAALSGGVQAIELCLKIGGIIAMWSGVMRVAEKAGMLDALAKLFSPLTRLLFRTKDQQARKHITTNMVANFLGLGNAATPSGIEAMRRLDTLNGKRGIATKDMVIFTVLNTASIQLIPTNIAAFRAAAGAAQPMDILPCIWVTSLFAAVSGILMANLLTGGRS